MADPTVRNISNFLENHLRSYGCERLLHYEDVVNAFDSLPELNGAWSSHPLSRLFDELDREDAAMALPFRTAIVVSKEEGKELPGQGFFTAYAKYANKGRKVRSEDRLIVHAMQLKALAEFYRK